MSMLLLHRSDLLAAFTCVNCESLQPWLEVGADPQPNQQPQQQQEPRFQWILAQLKLTDQQQVRLRLLSNACCHCRPPAICSNSAPMAAMPMCVLIVGISCAEGSSIIYLGFRLI
jgi:Fe-S-cluster-containing dehydrogenase component